MDNNINSGSMSSPSQNPNVCTQCGSTLGEDQLFCPNCGARKQQLLPNRNCFNCGVQVPHGIAFCPSCGAKIGDNSCEVNPAIAQFNENLTTTKKKKSVLKRVLTTIVVSLLVVALLGGGVWFFGIPYYNYKVACDALYNGEYDDAYQAFIDLNGFMDSG
jgi:uncharacterized membrane protein YvbJ